jgi:hypothetical protein|tara:strand:- start:6067 stop:6372 length:306 start_codon:yes stop_codon:yes gene_type:complete
MGIWQTNNASFKVNLVQSLIGKLKAKGCKFCWIKDNGAAMIAFNENKQKDEKDKQTTLKVITSDDDTVTGYIAHIVDGWCSGSPHTNWFIICPGRIIVEDL